MKPRNTRRKNPTEFEKIVMFANIYRDTTQYKLFCVNARLGNIRKDPKSGKFEYIDETKKINKSKYYRELKKIKSNQRVLEYFHDPVNNGALRKFVLLDEMEELNKQYPQLKIPHERIVSRGFLKKFGGDSKISRKIMEKFDELAEIDKNYSITSDLKFIKNI